MNKNIILIGGLGLFGAMALGLFGMWVSYNNTEIRLRNTIVAKQRDNANEFDNMIKKIGQTAEVTSEQMARIKDIIVGNAEARGKNGGGIFSFVHEAVPNLDTSTETFRNLQNIIVASRNTFTMRQKEILDLKREHDNIRTLFPSSIFVGGRSEIEVKIVTSTRADEAFATGKDDDTKLFNK